MTFSRNWPCLQMTWWVLACTMFKEPNIFLHFLLLQMLILLYSDTNYVLDGFRAEFFVTNCPNNCSDHGMCSPLHKCYCEGTWGGDDCGLDLCPEGCGRDQQRGECKMNRCRCERGYSGQACSLYRGDQTGNKWVLRFEVMALAKMSSISRLKLEVFHPEVFVK